MTQAIRMDTKPITKRPASLGRRLGVSPMKVRVTETLIRTIEIEVESNDPLAAVELAKAEALGIQPADWTYTWEPVTQAGEVLPE